MKVLVRFFPKADEGSVAQKKGFELQPMQTTLRQPQGDQEVKQELGKGVQFLPHQNA